MIPTLQLGGLGRSGLGALVADPYFSSVVSLMHLDGSNGSTTFTDQKTHTWTATSPCTISTAQSKFGGASAIFTVSTNSRISAPLSADWNWGTGDFTIELQVYFTSTSRFYCFDLGGNVAALIITPSSGLVEVYGPSSWVINTGSTAFNTGQWYAIALVRSGNAWTVYRDGVSYVSNSSDSRSWGTSAQSISIGASLTGSTQTLGGHIDEWRVTKGVARYTGTYTPQAVSFPNS